MVIKRPYTQDEIIIDEETIGNEMYLIVSGQVAMVHKKTQSYIIDLNVKIIVYLIERRVFWRNRIFWRSEKNLFSKIKGLY